MAHMTLPAAHSEADARLAQRIGQALQLEEVHVFWTLPVPVESAPPGVARPAPAKAAAEPVGGPAGLTGLIAALVGWLAPKPGSTDLGGASRPNRRRHPRFPAF